MEKDFFIELLHKHTSGKASEEEIQFLLSYYELFASEPEVLSLFSETQIEELKIHMRNNIWQGIELREKGRKNNVLTRSMIRRISAIAAILLIIFSTSLYFSNQSIPQNDNIVSRSTVIKQNRLIRLPDGSTVIVSAGSKLNYPSSFDDSFKREVYLEGEAYFDINHNALKPFIVHTGKIKTTVLGTAFNIRAWASDPDITVTVTRGKVKVVENEKILGIITPNQQITYNKTGSDIINKTVNAHDYLAWKEQDLLLDDVTVAEAAELLQDRFKVSIAISDEKIGSKRFTTTFLKGENLDRVLKSICEFNEATYTYDKKEAKIILSSK